MRRGRVGALAEDEQRAGLRPPPELDDADVGVAEVAVAPLLPSFGARVEVKDDAERAGSARHWQARAGVAERLVAARVHALETVDLAPRHAPGSPVPLQAGDRRFEGANPRPRREVSRGL